MGNFCGLCSCIYPKLDEFDDEEFFVNKYAIERSRVATDAFSRSNGLMMPALASESNGSISSYSSKSALAGAFQTQALAPRRLSLTSHKYDRQSNNSLFDAETRHATEIFAIYSPIKFSSRDMMLWPRQSATRSSLSSTNSSIVSLNDHKLFMEVADLHMSEIKRQFKQDAMFTSFARQSHQSHEDSGINMSLNSTATTLQLQSPTKSLQQASLFGVETMTPSPMSQFTVTQQQQQQQSSLKSTANQRGGRDDDRESVDGEEEENVTSPLVFFFKTINAITSSLIKTASFNTSLTIGSNYLYKWSTKNSITKLRSKMFKLASFSVAAFVNTTNTKSKQSNAKSSKKSVQANISQQQTSKYAIEAPSTTSEGIFEKSDALFSHEIETSLSYGSAGSYSFIKTSPLRQFILRVYDANFF